MSGFQTRSEFERASDCHDETVTKRDQHTNDPALGHADGDDDRGDAGADDADDHGDDADDGAELPMMVLG